MQLYKAPPTQYKKGWGFGSHPGDKLLDKIPTYSPLLNEGIYHEFYGLIMWSS